MTTSTHPVGSVAWLDDAEAAIKEAKIATPLAPPVRTDTVPMAVVTEFPSSVRKEILAPIVDELRAMGFRAFDVASPMAIAEYVRLLGQTVVR